MAYQFVPDNEMQLFEQMLNVSKENYSKIEFPFAIWKNFYLSDRELSDEFRYVFDRKYAKRQIGNNLDRPKLLMKRTFCQSTTFDGESLN